MSHVTRVTRTDVCWSTQDNESCHTQNLSISHRRSSGDTRRNVSCHAQASRNVTHMEHVLNTRVCTHIKKHSHTRPNLPTHIPTQSSPRPRLPPHIHTNKPARVVKNWANSMGEFRYLSHRLQDSEFFFSFARENGNRLVCHQKKQRSLKREQTREFSCVWLFEQT